MGPRPLFLATFAYLFGPISGAVVALLERRNIFSIYHGCQSVVMGVLFLICMLAFFWSSTLKAVVGVAYAILSLFMVVRVFQDSPRLEIVPSKKLCMFENKLTDIIRGLGPISFWCKTVAVQRVTNIRAVSGTPYHQ